MNHVDPSMSSGLSPGETLAVASHLYRSPSADNRPPFPAPHWRGEARPHGARRVRPQTRFPSPGYLTYLVRDLGYDGNAAFAAIVQAHQPWLHSVDRRRASANGKHAKPGYARLVSVVHPYIPPAPGRRTRVGGGLTKQQVEQALAKKRWASGMKKAVFEIVYRRRSNLEVSNESGFPVEILYTYAHRLRQDIAAANLPNEYPGDGPEMRVKENAGRVFSIT